MSYHFSQFVNHASQTVDIAVVPRIHVAQVGTKSAGIPRVLIEVYLQIRKMKLKIPQTIKNGYNHYNHLV